ncbi:MAG: hypothetical protein IJS68_00760 [Clostridia bacterium]|nr:hypothetical protein [Clostridia bacterium]
MKKEKNLSLSKDQLLETIKDRRICVLDGVSPCCHCGDCFMCDLDPNKLCDNCGKCLDTINTDEKGYAQIMVDRVEAPNKSLDEFYHMAGVDDVDLEEDEECCDDDCNCHNHNHNSN